MRVLALLVRETERQLEANAEIMHYAIGNGIGRKEMIGRDAINHRRVMVDVTSGAVALGLFYAGTMAGIIHEGIRRMKGFERLRLEEI